uniref:Translation initiation factor IF-1, chloroplastic n=1 Tax=Anthurium amnicola TaxID=1678845 RepID=A0A1D1YW30_9ARAE
MSVVFHPLPTSCAPAAASRSPGSHVAQRRSLVSPSSYSHGKYTHFSLQCIYHPADTNPLLPAPSRSLPSKKYPGFCQKDYFFAGPCICSSGDGGGSILVRCTRPPALGSTFPYGVPEVAAFWSGPTGVSPLRRWYSTSQVAAAGRPSNSKKEDKLVTEGLITELLSNCMFRVRLDNGEVILGYVSGKMRTKMVRVMVGDRVKIEVSRYDSTKGRIVYRLRSKSSTD